jgi:hypothetical protein
MNKQNPAKMSKKREINKKSIKIPPPLKKCVPRCLNCKVLREKIDIIGTNAGIAHNIFKCPICGRKKALR